MGKELDKKPQNKKDIAGLMPDEWDKRNIQSLVETFMKTTFDIPTSDDFDGPHIKVTGKQWIASTVSEARQRHEVELNEFALKGDQMQLRALTSVPRPLHMQLLKGYPTLFSDYRQHIWFAKNFPMFRIPTKT